MLHATLLQRRSFRLFLAASIAISLLLLLVTFTLQAANSIVWKDASTGLPTSGTIRDVAFGDFNNDGKPDLIAVGTNGVVVYKGDGTGNWNGTGNSTGLPTSGQYGHVIVGDFNNDGKLDIAATQSAEGIQAWTGNGAGTWTAWSGLPVAGNYEGLALADVNRDGWPDLIVAGGGPGNPGILVFQNSFASFSQTTSITTTGTYYDVAAGYVDTDGAVDVAAASQTSGLKFWRGNYGSWTYTSAGLTTTGTYRGVAFSDVDLDGKPELLASRSGSPGPTGGGLFIYKYDIGTGSWSLAPNQIPLTASYSKLELGDLNNDGWPDLVAGGGSASGSPGIFTWLGSLNGFVATTSPTSSNNLDRIAIGDLDRNGLLDIGAGENSGGGAYAWRDTGARDPVGSWHAIASPQITGVVRALGFGDFNRDGKLDVVMSRDINAGLVAWLGDGGNSWTTCAITMTPGAQTGDWEDLVVGPFYRYSVAPDVIAASSNGGGIRYFGQAGTGCTYWYDTPIASTGSFRGLSAGDIDHDSFFDIVAAPSNLINAGLRLWAGGVNGWTAFTPVATGNYYDTALGDFNNDGWLDIVAASDVDGIRVFRSNASLRSWTTFTVTASGAYQAIAVGDFNNDGKLDIAAGANGSTNTGIDIWLGDGTFTTWTPWPGPVTTDQYFDLSVGDVNHDGWLDILAGGETGGPQVWLGDGAGGWTASNTGLATTGAYFRSQFGHIDHDGNLDILATIPGSGLQMWTAAEAAPPTISNIRPSGWISTTQSPTILGDVIDTGSGISVTSGLYRYSTNGGSTWSGFLPAAISGSNGSTTTQSITAVSVPFNQDSGTQNKIEFRASDMVGNIGTAQATVKIDTVPPTAPTSLSSSDHTVNVWSNNALLTLNWSGATDATSGVYAYSVALDHVTNTLPAPAINAYATSYITSPLADAADWYAHVRTMDAAGNWSTTAIHLGPFKIDTTPPTNPTSVSSTDHTLGVWSGDPTISMIWSGATDGGSGVSAYSYLFDTSSGTLPDTTIDTFGTSATSAALPSGSNKYFHIRTRDVAGNWSTVAAQAGAYWIDVTPPYASASSPGSVGSTSFTVSWSGGDYGQSGIASYDVQYRDATTGGSWITWKSYTTSTSATFFATGGHIYQFRARARDNVGNLGSYTGSFDSQTQVATIDLFMRSPGIEVNQAVQDLNNGVLLIANKRTFVRCYAQSASGNYASVPGRLSVYRGATYMGTLAPSNSGATITVKSSPDRGQLNDAYYFDVPTGWLSAGSVTFYCEVNTPLKYADSNYGNDIAGTTLTFVNSRPMNIAMIDADYWFGGVVRHVRSVDRTRLAAWLRTAYPINQLNVYYGYLDPPYSSLPNVDTVNSDLAWNKSKRVFGAGETSSWRYYGQAIDIGGFMRGKSIGTPGNVAAGPTGDTSGWDPDGNYGDWYGGHENGHSYGRAHVRGAPYAGPGGCGDEAGPDGSYPYAQGRMSPGTSMWANNTLYGFDWSLSTPFVVPPTWYDVMTYCPGQWISDYTYRAIWTRMNTEPVMAHAQRQTATEYLGVFGQIITATNVVTLNTFYRVPDGSDVFGRDLSGTYYIRLLGAGNGVLADYNFSPRGDVETDSPVQLITEMVPWITGTQKIVIASATQDLITRTVSTHAPTVTLQAPSGGITLTGSSVIVSWSASDADGDPLTFSLDYSKDGGVTWQPLSPQVPSTTLTINLDQLPGSPTGKFRVWASDGVNTATGENTGTFVVPSKAPQILSIAPLSGTTYVVSQTVTLEGSAFDAEDNVLGDPQLQWTSSLQGVLGTGSLLQLTDLITGTHVITLMATDSDNNVTTATTVITISEQNLGGPYDLFLPLVLRN